MLRAEADLIQVAYQWAVSHPLEPDDTAWIAAGKAAAVTGDGAPDFDELSVAELAAALGMSTPAGVRLVTDAVDLAHRHPRLWARVRAGNLPCWRARKVAQATALLSARAAGYVDAEIAPVADRVGSTRLARLVEEAIARFDPDMERTRALRCLVSLSCVRSRWRGGMRRRSSGSPWACRRCDI